MKARMWVFISIVYLGSIFFIIQGSVEAGSSLALVFIILGVMGIACATYLTVGMVLARRRGTRL